MSVLQGVEGVQVFEDTEKGDGPKLISKEVSAAFYYSSWCPVQILPPKDKARWITDYVPFGAESVLARWPGDSAKTSYGIWRYIEKESKWKCAESKEYDDAQWNSTVLGCYHFGERVKTLLIAIALTNK